MYIYTGTYTYTGGDEDDKITEVVDSALSTNLTPFPSVTSVTQANLPKEYILINRDVTAYPYILA